MVTGEIPSESLINEEPESQNPGEFSSFEHNFSRLFKHFDQISLKFSRLFVSSFCHLKKIIYHVY